MHQAEGRDSQRISAVQAATKSTAPEMHTTLKSCTSLGSRLGVSELQDHAGTLLMQCPGPHVTPTESEGHICTWLPSFWQPSARRLSLRSWMRLGFCFAVCTAPSVLRPQVAPRNFEGGAQSSEKPCDTPCSASTWGSGFRASSDLFGVEAGPTHHKSGHIS